MLHLSQGLPSKRKLLLSTLLWNKMYLVFWNREDTDYNILSGSKTGNLRIIIPPGQSLVIALLWPDCVLVWSFSNQIKFKVGGFRSLFVASSIWKYFKKNKMIDYNNNPLKKIKPIIILWENSVSFIGRFIILFFKKLKE